MDSVADTVAGNVEMGLAETDGENDREAPALGLGADDGGGPQSASELNTSGAAHSLHCRSAEPLPPALLASPQGGPV